MSEPIEISIPQSDETPDVIDTGDTVVVAAPPPAEATPDPYLERFMQTDERLNHLTSLVEGLVNAQTQTTVATAANAEVVEELAEVVEEQQREDAFVEDEIVPQQTHPWFRGIDEWRGVR